MFNPQRNSAHRVTRTLCTNISGRAYPWSSVLLHLKWLMCLVPRNWLIRDKFIHPRYNEWCRLCCHHLSHSWAKEKNISLQNFIKISFTFYYKTITHPCTLRNLSFLLAECDTFFPYIIVHTLIKGVSDIQFYPKKTFWHLVTLVQDVDSFVSHLFRCQKPQLHWAWWETLACRLFWS